MPEPQRLSKHPPNLGGSTRSLSKFSHAVTDRRNLSLEERAVLVWSGVITDRTTLIKFQNRWQAIEQNSLPAEPSPSVVSSAIDLNTGSTKCTGIVLKLCCQFRLKMRGYKNYWSKVRPVVGYWCLAIKQLRNDAARFFEVHGGARVGRIHLATDRHKIEASATT